jgi:hypothetical protein
VQVIEELHDRKAEADHRHGGVDPRQRRIFQREARLQPGKVTIGRHLGGEPTGLRAGLHIAHGF